MNQKFHPDAIDWALIEALQRDARTSFAELGRAVGLSAPAAAERVRRLEDRGVVRGYHADVDLAALGRPVRALLRLAATDGKTCGRLLGRLQEIPEITNAYRVTGDDSAVALASVASVEALEELIDRLSGFCRPTTALVTSAFERRPTAEQDAPQPVVKV